MVFDLPNLKSTHYRSVEIEKSHVSKMYKMQYSLKNTGQGLETVTKERQEKSQYVYMPIYFFGWGAGLSKKEKVPMDKDNSVVIWGGGSKRGLNCNRKNIQ